MDRSYVAENEAERARLKAIVDRLTDADLARPMSEDWTVGVGLMHLAFWDGLSLSKFEEWERTGEVQIPPMRDMVDGINHAMLPWWRTIAPAQVRHAVVAAAEAVDHKAETLPAPIIEAILALRPQSLMRANHRRQHLDQIERALAGETGITRCRRITVVRHRGEALILDGGCCRGHRRHGWGTRDGPRDLIDGR